MLRVACTLSTFDAQTRGKRMNCRIRIFAAVLALAGMGAAQAALQARDLDNNTFTDAYYDTVLNITWLADANANGPMTWNVADTWANALGVGGYNDWRLPATLPVNGIALNTSTFSNNGSTDIGYGGTASEMGHLY
jgi:hypothetical protein